MNYIAYTRVSTKKQKHGLKAQNQQIADYAKANQGKIMAAFQDQISGKNAHRPGLSQAITMAKKHNATLIIAKLDRLSRDIRFIFDLKEQLENNSIPLVCIELPMLNTLTIGIFATMAQYEREIISQRTKKGLQAAKKSGKTLGRPKKTTIPLLPIKHSNLGCQANQQAAEHHSQKIALLAQTLRKEGHTLAKIAAMLGQAGHKTRRGKEYSPTAISRIINKNST